MVLRDRLGDAADSVLRDLRFAWRALLRSPAFTLAAIASLAIGIGATTAVFSLADAVLLRALPLPDPDRLVEMIAVFPDGHRQTNLEPEAFEVLRREGVSTAEVFAQAFDRVGLRTVGDAAAPVDVLYVSGKYFDALGAGAVRGRVLREQDDRAGVQPTAVLSHRFWTSRFGSRPDVVGQDVWINGTTATIVGVVPQDFFGVDRGLGPQVFLPLSAAATGRQPWVLGRLRPGVSSVGGPGPSRYRLPALGRPHDRQGRRLVGWRARGVPRAAPRVAPRGPRHGGPRLDDGRAPARAGVHGRSRAPGRLRERVGPPDRARRGASGGDRSPLLNRRGTVARRPTAGDRKRGPRRRGGHGRSGARRRTSAVADPADPTRRAVRGAAARVELEALGIRAGHLVRRRAGKRPVPGDPPRSARDVGVAEERPIDLGRLAHWPPARPARGPGGGGRGSADRNGSPREEPVERREGRSGFSSHRRSSRFGRPFRQSPRVAAGGSLGRPAHEPPGGASRSASGVVRRQEHLQRTGFVEAHRRARSTLRDPITRTPTGTRSWVSPATPRSPRSGRL